jgi:hypothetical protein
MAVITHGSDDDQDVIVLKLPPIFEALAEQSLKVETDPVFTGWDKSTGISISKSQIDDRSDILTTDGASGTTAIGTISLNSSGTVTGSNLSGNNTGDQDLSGLVPYTGAAHDLALGAHSLSSASVTINNTPVASTDAITKGYFDTHISTGVTWKAAVLDIVTTLPGGAAVGDRYIHATDNKINQWNGASWDVTTPTTGDTLFVAGDIAAPTNFVGNYTYGGSSWIYMGTSINHNDTLNKEGGSGGHWFHLSDTTNTAVANITQSGSDIVPTGLATSSTGVTPGKDGSSYVVLTWDAIATGTFDHYQVEYKKTSYYFYTPLQTANNTILIDGLSPGTSYNFRLSSVNKYGTASAFCTDLIVTTPGDSIAPATVTGVTVIGITQACFIKWASNSDIDLDSYNLYKNTVNNSGTSTLVVNLKSTGYIDNGLPVNTTYYYWVKAKDTSGNLSVSYSTVASGTTQKLPATDLANIAASQVIIQGATTLSSWSTPGFTTIDGGKITTGSITTSQLTFDPALNGHIVASINSHPEGLQIDTANFAISGATIFTKSLGGSYASANSVPRVRIFPNDDPNTAIEVVDDYGRFAFRALIGGNQIGDIIIGNWAGNQGIYYDASAQTTSFAGSIVAGAGLIGGWTILGSSLVKDTGSNYNSSGMAPGDYPFYAGATYANRASAPFKVSYGGMVTTGPLTISGLTDYSIIQTLTGGGIIASPLTFSNGALNIALSSGIILPRISGNPGSPVTGMMYYNTALNNAFMWNGSTWKAVT